MVEPGVPDISAENPKVGADQEKPLLSPEAPTAPGGLVVSQDEAKNREPVTKDGDPDEIDLDIQRPKNIAAKEVLPEEPDMAEFNPKIVDETPESVQAASEMTKDVGTGPATDTSPEK